PVHGERRPPLRRGPRARFDRRAPTPRADRPLARRGAGLRRHRTRDPRHLSAPATPDLSRRAGRTASPSAAARVRRPSPLLAARPRAAAAFRSLREHAQTLEEADLVDALGRTIGGAGEAENPGAVRDAVVRLKSYYQAQVKALRERARFVTHLSTGLFIGIV